MENAILFSVLNETLLKLSTLTLIEMLSSFFISSNYSSRVRYWALQWTENKLKYNFSYRQLAVSNSAGATRKHWLNGKELKSFIGGEVKGQNFLGSIPADHLPTGSGHGPLHTQRAEARSKEGRHIWFSGHCRFRQGSRTQGPGHIYPIRLFNPCESRSRCGDIIRPLSVVVISLDLVYTL